MAWKITKDKLGNYNVWSTIVDDYIFCEVERDWLIDFYIKEAAKDAEKKITEWLDEVDKNYDKQRTKRIIRKTQKPSRRGNRKF